MSMPGAYEVFVLLDHANGLAGWEGITDRWLLDLTAGAYLAADVAMGEQQPAVEPPDNVGECIRRASELTRGWEPTQSSTSAHLLRMLVADLVTEVGC